MRTCALAPLRDKYRLNKSHLWLEAADLWTYLLLLLYSIAHILLYDRIFFSTRLLASVRCAEIVCGNLNRKKLSDKNICFEFDESFGIHLSFRVVVWFEIFVWKRHTFSCCCLSTGFLIFLFFMAHCFACWFRPFCTTNCSVFGPFGW